MRIIIGIVLFIAINGFAIEITRRDDRIYLQDRSCKEVEDVTKSLRDWAVQSGAKNVCSIDEQMPTVIGDNCEFDITQCVPDHVAKYQGVSPKLSGPNCYNLALVMSGIVPALRLSLPEELSFYMRSPLCRQLKNGEAKIPGDIGTIKDLSGEFVHEKHAFIYISDKIAYSKNGMEKESPYSIQPLERVLSVYDVKSKECEQNETDFKTSCPAATSFFRCSSMKEYLKNNTHVPAELRAAFKGLAAYERCLECRTFSGTVLTEEAKRDVIGVANALAAYLEEERKNDNLIDMSGDEIEFVLGALQLKLASLLQQMMFTRDHSWNWDETKNVELTEALKKANLELNDNWKGERLWRPTLRPDESK